MFSVRVICINLLILHSSVCEEYHCYSSRYNEDEIKLIQKSYSRISDQLNAEFINKCHYNYKISKLNDSDIRFNYTLEQALKYKNVIDLYVPDYYRYFNPEKYEDIVYAGNLNYCPGETKKVPEKEKNIEIKQLRKEYINCYDKVKLVSKDVKMNFGDLYNFVTSIQYENGRVTSRHNCYTTFENATELKTILLCLKEGPDHNIEIDIKPLKLVISMDCKKKLRTDNDNFLALLAPKPFAIDTDYNLIPAIFYETPYLSLKDDVSFVNSVTLLPWQLLKYVYLQFLRSMCWSRVVIFSDDSLYSINFEYELTQLFNDERIVYTVLRCEEADCKTDKAHERLISVGATIVIANVEQSNAEILLNTASNSRFVWLVRDLSMNVHQSFYQQVVFSFSLASTSYKSPKCYYNDAILDGISRIIRANRHLNNTKSALKKKEFYRKLAEEIRKVKPETDKVLGLVRRASNPNDTLQVLINKDGVHEVLTFNNPFNNKVSDGVNCFVRSYNYFNPCEDILILVFMLVILIFATILLLITCYLHKTSPLQGIKYPSTGTTILLKDRIRAI